MSVTPSTDLSAKVVLYDVSPEAHEAIRVALPEHDLCYSDEDAILEMDAVLHDVSWKAYEAILAARGEHRLRHSYDRGTLEIMSPTQKHEWSKSLVARFIEAMALDLDIPIKSVGSTTRRRKRAKRGLEPDESYYIQNERVVRGKWRYDPRRDPPPDLAIEIDVSSSSVDRMGIYEKLRVPEIWRFDGETVRFYGLSDAGHYVEIDRSLAFPFLAATDVTRFLEQLEFTDENSIVRSFVAWAHRKAKQSNR